MQHPIIAATLAEQRQADLRYTTAHATQLITSQEHDWLAGKVLLTAARLTYRLCDSRKPVKKALTVAVCAGQGGCGGPART